MSTRKVTSMVTAVRPKRGAGVPTKVLAVRLPGPVVEEIEARALADQRNVSNWLAIQIRDLLKQTKAAA